MWMLLSKLSLSNRRRWCYFKKVFWLNKQICLKNYLVKVQIILKKKIDTSLFLEEPYLRTKYEESNIEEDKDLKSQFTFRN